MIVKYGCFDLDMLKKDIPSINKIKLENNINQAQKKLLLNRKIRNMYFEAEDLLDRAK